MRSPRRRLKARPLALLFVLPVVLVTTACPGDGPAVDPEPTIPPAPTATPTPATGGTVKVGVFGSPATLDPYSPVASDLTWQLVRPVYPSLFRVEDPSGASPAQPYLAEEIEEVRGGVRVTLRAARWSNGRPITARDVVASIRRAQSPSGFSRITTARVLGPRRVLLKGPVREWPDALATRALVLPGGRATPSIAGDTGKKGSVSGGPFTIRKYVPGLKIVYRRNRRALGPTDHAYLDRVEVQFVAGHDLLFGLVRAERLDVIVPPSTVNLETRLDAMGLEHSVQFGWETLYLDLSEADLSRSQRGDLVRSLNRGVIEIGLIRDGGGPLNHLGGGPGTLAQGATWPTFVPRGKPTDETVQISGSAGDELVEFLQKVMQVQLTKRGYDIELLTLDYQTFYGPGVPSQTFDVAVRRRVLGPGSGLSDRAFQSLTEIPLFLVGSYVAWHAKVSGPAANPTIDGPLWNMDEWFRVDL